MLIFNFSLTAKLNSSGRIVNSEQCLLFCRTNKLIGSSLLLDISMIPLNVDCPFFFNIRGFWSKEIFVRPIRPDKFEENNNGE